MSASRHGERIDAGRDRARGHVRTAAERRDRPDHGRASVDTRRSTSGRAVWHEALETEKRCIARSEPRPVDAVSNRMTESPHDSGDENEAS